MQDAGTSCRQPVDMSAHATAGVRGVRSKNRWRHTPHKLLLGRTHLAVKRAHTSDTVEGRGGGRREVAPCAVSASPRSHRGGTERLATTDVARRTHRDTARALDDLTGQCIVSCGPSHVYSSLRSPRAAVPASGSTAGARGLAPSGASGGAGTRSAGPGAVNSDALCGNLPDTLAT